MPIDGRWTFKAGDEVPQWLQATENCRATWMCDVVVTRTTDNRFEARPTSSPEDGVIFIVPIVGGRAILMGDLDVLLVPAP